MHQRRKYHTKWIFKARKRKRKITNKDRLSKINKAQRIIKILLSRQINEVINQLNI